MMADDIPGPNGLAFSPDEKKLYVVASRAEPHRTILSYDVSADGTTLAKGTVLIDAGPGGSPDGFRVDVDGNLWCGWGMGSAELDGVRVFNPGGQADRPHRPARALRQRLLRRTLPQPPVHGGQPLALRALRQHAGRARRLIHVRSRVRAMPGGASPPA